MTTIKELYDLGQRQFPMRGGGVSPILHISKTDFYDEEGEIEETRTQLLAEKINPYSDGIGWDIDGTYCNNQALDLLPIPLPDYKAKYEALKKACEEIKKLWQQYGEIYWDGTKAPEDRVYKTPESRVEWSRDLADVECLLNAAIQAIGEQDDRA